VALAEGSFREARAILTDLLVQSREYGVRAVVAQHLCSLGVLAVAEGQHAVGARLLGAGAVVNPLFSSIHCPGVRVDAADSVVRARSALGEEAFARAWAEGQAMTLEQAVEYALSDDGEA
jgi:hypothetical protein